MIMSTRSSEKEAQSAEIAEKTREFLRNGGQIQVIEPQKSECNLVWRDYAVAGFAERQGLEDAA